jgi:hypothetical protein
MSFDLFVQCYGETRLSGLPTSAVRSLFPIGESQPAFWSIQYGTEDGCDLYPGFVEEDEGKLKDFMVARPCGDPRFWEALYSILRMGSVVAYWPESPPILAVGASLEGLPDGMQKALGLPVYVKSGMELLKRVQET